MELMGKKEKITAWSFLLLGLIGIIDSLYLSQAYFLKKGISCNVFEGCTIVLKSEYSAFLGIPLPVFGLLYYALILIGVLYFFRSQKYKALKYVMYLTAIGFVVSLVLFYLQWQVIEAFCQYCVLSAVISTLMFIISLFSLKKKNPA